ncbi:hypothetical protein ENUP19_0161G0035 [Entamoeba nuttalli]|uniref:Uncharacterized protein n=2 Tax=Entamoeba nuttalli TaxID=412467 RepID=K2HQ23_ENTNP|nr:hypothetical protein ENU1_179390 [Entamoeba nuttalli P19]EKE38005.1 hypothetical protein ENU1_179390 [Entamoeba nuttalli P19]|eukprot:XP_008859658.1 hypothetical protein ENU1_179390 [Entamoeba nuttalli P19]
MKSMIEKIKSDGNIEESQHHRVTNNQSFEHRSEIIFKPKIGTEQLLRNAMNNNITFFSQDSGSIGVTAEELMKENSTNFEITNTTDPETHTDTQKTISYTGIGTLKTETPSSQKTMIFKPIEDIENEDALSGEKTLSMGSSLDRDDDIEQFNNKKVMEEENNDILSDDHTIETLTADSDNSLIESDEEKNKQQGKPIFSKQPLTRIESKYFDESLLGNVPTIEKIGGTEGEDGYFKKTTKEEMKYESSLKNQNNNYFHTVSSKYEDDNLSSKETIVYSCHSLNKKYDSVCESTTAKEIEELNELLEERKMNKKSFYFDRSDEEDEKLKTIAEIYNEEEMLNQPELNDSNDSSRDTIMTLGLNEHRFQQIVDSLDLFDEYNELNEFEREAYAKLFGKVGLLKDHIPVGRIQQPTPREFHSCCEKGEKEETIKEFCSSCSSIEELELFLKSTCRVLGLNWDEMKQFFNTESLGKMKESIINLFKEIELNE